MHDQCLTGCNYHRLVDALHTVEAKEAEIAGRSNVIAQRDREIAGLLATIATLTESYRCYHCGIRFTDGEAASRHFGTATNDTPLCQADKMLIVIARKERDEYAEIRARLLAKNAELRAALESEATYFEKTFGKYMGMSGDFVAKRLRALLGLEAPGASPAPDAMPQVPQRPKLRFTEEACPGHVASENDPKVCGRCGIHIDSLRPHDEEAAPFARPRVRE